MGLFSAKRDKESVFKNVFVNQPRGNVVDNKNRKTNQELFHLKCQYQKLLMLFTHFEAPSQNWTRKQ